MSLKTMHNILAGVVLLAVWLVLASDLTGEMKTALCLLAAAACLASEALRVMLLAPRGGHELAMTLVVFTVVSLAGSVVALGFWLQGVAG
jgi:hypothetical protein